MKKLLTLLVIIGSFALYGCDDPTHEVSCDDNPHQEKCEDDPVQIDCDANPDHEDCQSNPVEVDCDLTPNHEDCQTEPVEVDCSVTPDHEDCDDPVLECNEGWHIEGDQCVEDIPVQLVHLSSTKNIVNMTENFTILKRDLDIFTYDEKPGVNYISVFEFIDLTKYFTKALTIDNEDDLTLQYRYIYGPQPTAYYDFKMVINADTDKIYLNDSSMFNAMTNSIYDDFEMEVELISNNYFPGPVYLNLDLGKYDIDIVQENDQYYIPFYLANFLLSGTIVEIYEDTEEILIFDDYDIMFETTEALEKATPTSDEGLAEETKNFTEFVLDNFYGLKDHKEIDAFKDVFTELDFDSATNIIDVQHKIDELILYLDDLHTSVFTYGYLNEGYEFVIPTELPSKTDNFYASGANFQCERLDNIELVETDDEFILTINGFTIDSRDEFKAVLSTITPDKPLYIDLTCNTGGLLTAVLELMPYFDTDGFTFYSKIVDNNFRYLETYDHPQDVTLENEVYLITSGVTYSAANLFASLFEQEDMGTIIGAPTSGGACAIGTAVLPDSSIIVYSTTYCMTDDNHKLIESGITPDVLIDDLYSVESIINQVNKLFEENTSYTLDISNTGNEYTYSMDVSAISNSYFVEYYILQVYDQNDNYLREEIIFSEDFEHTLTLQSGEYVKINVNYSIDGNRLDTYIYNSK